MCRNVIVAVALAAVTGGSLWAQTRTPEVQFKAAEQKEQGEGDLKGAIREYERVVNGKDRALAAQALLRIADIHRRLGNKEADKVYERLIRDFKEQTEAVSIARARLSAPAAARGTELRHRVVPGTQDASLLVAAVSPDGRYFAFSRQDNAGSTLVVRDLTTGATRAVSATTTSNPRTYVYSPVFSADGRQLVYQWCSPQCELRLISLQEPGIPRFRTLDRGRWVDAMSWTPDNRAVVVFRTHDEKTSDIALVSTADGSVRVLKQNPGPYSRMYVSPDGRNLALDHRAPGGSSWDISIVPMDGSPEFAAVDHVAEDRLAGWSPDSKYLLFVSNRNTGLPGLYALAFADGRPDRTPPRLLYSNLGGVFSLGVTKAGALLYFDEAPNGYSDIQVAPFDFATGTLGAAGSLGVERGGSNTGPAWSRDGKYLAYVSTPLAPVASAQPTVMVHDVEGGSNRELRPGLNSLGQLKWSPDGRSLLAFGYRPGIPPGIFRVDVQTGEATRLLVEGNNPAWSPDGNTIYVRRTFSPDQGGGAVFIARDLASGSERELIRRPALGAVNISPDGRFIATGADDVAADTRTILLIPTGGGEPRVLRVNRPRGGGVPMWAPDSRSVVVRVSTEEAWRYPLDGGQPVRLASWADVPGGPQLSPDGKRVAVERQVRPAQSREPGIWVLENFLPKESK